jgi:hypothetical protein
MLRIVTALTVAVALSAGAPASAGELSPGQMVVGAVPSASLGLALDSGGNVQQAGTVAFDVRRSRLAGRDVITIAPRD